MKKTSQSPRKIDSLEYSWNGANKDLGKGQPNTESFQEDQWAGKQYKGVELGPYSQDKEDLCCLSSRGLELLWAVTEVYFPFQVRVLPEFFVSVLCLCMFSMAICACGCLKGQVIFIVLAHRSLNQKMLYNVEYIMKFWYLVGAIMGVNIENSLQRIVAYFVYKKQGSEYLWPGVQTVFTLLLHIIYSCLLCIYIYIYI